MIAAKITIVSSNNIEIWTKSSVNVFKQIQFVQLLKLYYELYYFITYTWSYYMTTFVAVVYTVLSLQPKSRF